MIGASYRSTAHRIQPVGITQSPRDALMAAAISSDLSRSQFILSSAILIEYIYYIVTFNRFQVLIVFRYLPALIRTVF